MMIYLQEKPIAVMMVATFNFQQYKSGIFSCQPSEMDQSLINHGVQVVGYNATGKYYIIKNSWGTTWGMDGFGYVDMTNDCMIKRKIFIVNGDV